MAEYIILCELAHDKYLVEKTSNPDKSFQRHVDGMGGMFTQLHIPFMIIEKTIVNTQDEINLLIENYRKTYGQNNVLFIL